MKIKRNWNWIQDSKEVIDKAHTAPKNKLTNIYALSLFNSTDHLSSLLGNYTPCLKLTIGSLIK